MKKQTFLIRLLSMCLSVVLMSGIITLTFSNPVKAIDDGKIELHYRPSGDGICNFTVDDFSDVPQGYYKIKVLVDGATETYFVIENAPYLSNSYMTIWAFNQIGGQTPTSSFQITQGTILEPVDPNNNWERDNSRNDLTMSNTLYMEKMNGGWTEKKSSDSPVASKKVGLSFVQLFGSDKHFLLDETTADVMEVGYYRATAEIDGVPHEIVLEYCSDTNIFIYANFFTAIPGDANNRYPTNTFVLEEDTSLIQVSAVDGWSEIVGGHTYQMQSRFELIKKDNNWSEVKQESEEPTNPETQKETVAVSIGDCVFQNNGVFSAYVIKWSPKPVDKSWIDLVGKGIVDGKERSVTITIPGNGELFFATDGATKTISILKDAEFITADGSLALKFDKNYELDLANNVVYEQGNKPEEKKPVKLELSYQQLVEKSFAFSWKMANGTKPEAGFYRTQAVIDGKEHAVLIEYFAKDNLFFIYPHCFNDIPDDEKSVYPNKAFVLKEGAVLTPVSSTSWGKNTIGQPYKLTKCVNMVKKDGIWMDADYEEQLETLEPIQVHIAFDSVQDRAMILKVVMKDGKEISKLYGDWTTAKGEIHRGIINNKTKKFEYTKVQAAYSIAGTTFYMDGLNLHELDGIQINKGTILYPEKTCKSDQPIEIMNDFRLVRDKNDEWVVDYSFTTYQEAKKEPTEDRVQDNLKEETEDITSQEENKNENLVALETDDENYSAGNILFHGEEKINTVFLGGDGLVFSLEVLIAGISILAVGVGILIFLMLSKRKKNKHQEE